MQWIDQARLRDAVEQWGPVETVKVVLDHTTGNSKGFGFATFRNRADGERCIEEMDGGLWGDRRVVVREARSRVMQ